MSHNLPDDVTHADIDKHFGGPETRRVFATVEVAVSVETQHFNDPSLCEDELLRAAMDGEIDDALSATIEEVEPR